MNLHSKHLKTLQTLFSKHPTIAQALLFGSRALGTHKESSDIDIALKGDITPTLLAHLKEELEDSTLPYFCDILDYERAPQELKEHIDTHALTLYKREEEWQEVRLGDIVEIVNGYAFKSKDFLSAKTDNALPIIKIKNVANGDVNLDDVQYHYYDSKLHRYVIRKTDILISLTGNHPHANTQVVGKVSRYKLEQEALLNQRVANIYPKENIDKDFLYYFLKLDSTHQELASKSSGSGNQANISKSDIESLIIPLPPLERQKEIAEILSSFDDKIDFLHRQNRTLEALNQVVFTEWFVNQTKDEWQEIELGKYLQCITGYSYKSSDLGRSKNALVNLKNFSRNGDFRLDGLKEFIGTKYKEAQTVKHGDLVVAHTDITQEADIIGNPILIIDMGKYENLIISMDLMKIKSNEKWLSTEFLYYLFKTSLFKQHCLANSNGTTVLHMSRQTIPTYKIKIPSIKKIEEFTIYAREKLEKKYNNLLQISTLEKLRNKILQSI